SDALENKEGDQYHRQGQHTRQWPKDQDQTEHDRERRVQWCPSEAGHRASAPHRQGAENTTYEEQPADKDAYGECRDVGLDHGEKPKHHHHNALREHELPMGMDRRRHLAADAFDIALNAHGSGSQMILWSRL